MLGCRTAGAAAIWYFDVDRERRDGAAAVHCDLHLVGIEGDMAGDDRENFLAQHAKQIGLVARLALVSEEDLQALARNRRGPGETG